MKRDALLRYAREHFNAEPEYLWRKFPAYAVLRHQKNNKWFGIVMNVPGRKLGLKTDEETDVLVIKARPEYIGSLRQKEGILPAYHMNKERWISVLLSGPLPAKAVYALLAESYALTA